MAAKSFAKALELVLVHEGGYSNHPKDPGGATMKGITQRVYDLYRSSKKLSPKSVKNISKQEVADIYRTRYWDAIHGDDLPVGVDYVVFDGAVNSGPGQSVKWLQRALGESYQGIIDGRAGPSTIAATRDHPNHDALIVAVCDRRLRFLKALKTWGTFGRGWAARVRDIERIGQEWATGAQPASLRASFFAGGDAKAFLEDAKGKAWQAPGDAAAGAGGLTAILSQATDQISPYADIEFVGKALALLTIAGVVMAIGGFAWRLWADQRRKARADALDLNPVS